MATIRASCPDCGDVELTTADLTVRVCQDDSQGSYLFRCPVCRMTATKNAEARIVELLVSSGVCASPPGASRPRCGSARRVRPLTHDDLLDFHALLESEDWFARLSLDHHLRVDRRGVSALWIVPALVAHGRGGGAGRSGPRAGPGRERAAGRAGPQRGRWPRPWPSCAPGPTGCGAPWGGARPARLATMPFNVGAGELLVVLLVALLVLGPDKLPQAARNVGKAMGEGAAVDVGLPGRAARRHAGARRRHAEAGGRPATAAGRAGRADRLVVHRGVAAHHAPRHLQSGALQLGALHLGDHSSGRR